MAKAQQSPGRRTSGKAGVPRTRDGAARADAGPAAPGTSAPRQAATAGTPATGAARNRPAGNGAPGQNRAAGQATSNGAGRKAASRSGPGGGGAARDGGKAGQGRTTRQGGTATVARGPEPGETAVPPAPAWLMAATWLLSLAGLGFSVYLTIAHLTSPAFLSCPEHGVINCARVTTSPQSQVFGILPVAELGLAFYVFLAVINSPWAWRLRRLRLRLVTLGNREVRWVRLGSLIVGIGFVLYLLYAELIQIGNICLFCTGVHIVTFLLFVLIVFDSVFRQAPAKIAGS